LRYGHGVSNFSARRCCASSRETDRGQPQRYSGLSAQRPEPMANIWFRATPAGRAGVSSGAGRMAVQQTSGAAMPSLTMAI
jgi:hypothetical protein